MLELLGIAAALFIAWLAKQAFAGKCSANRISQAEGAWILLKWIFILAVGGFVGLIALAALLSHLNGSN